MSLKSRLKMLNCSNNKLGQIYFILYIFQQMDAEILLDLLEIPMQLLLLDLIYIKYSYYFINWPNTLDRSNICLGLMIIPEANA